MVLLLRVVCCQTTWARRLWVNFTLYMHNKIAAATTVLLLLVWLFLLLLRLILLLFGRRRLLLITLIFHIHCQLLLLLLLLFLYFIELWWWSFGFYFRLSYHKSCILLWELLLNQDTLLSLAHLQIVTIKLQLNVLVLLLFYHHCVARLLDIKLITASTVLLMVIRNSYKWQTTNNLGRFFISCSMSTLVFIITVITSAASMLLFHMRLFISISLLFDLYAAILDSWSWRWILFE